MLTRTLIRVHAEKTGDVVHQKQQIAMKFIQ
jgi:hypothetical protein